MSLWRVLRWSAVILVLFVMLALSLVSQAQKARIVAARAQEAAYCQALMMYYRDHGYWPDPEAGLAALVTVPSKPGSPGPYLDPPVVRTDPWGTPYRYRRTEAGVTVGSAGPNRHFGDADDIWMQTGSGNGE